MQSYHYRSYYEFQFTHPGRGATPIEVKLMQANVEFQFTHPGRGATLRLVAVLPRLCVSIHAPREGCDDDTQGLNSFPVLFQFTHPGRGATPCQLIFFEG